MFLQIATATREMMPLFFRIQGCWPSFDPIALDQACVGLCQEASLIRNSQLVDNLAKPDWHHHHDQVKDSNPNVSWA